MKSTPAATPARASSSDVATSPTRLTLVHQKSTAAATCPGSSANRMTSLRAWTRSASAVSSASVRACTRKPTSPDPCRCKASTAVRIRSISARQVRSRIPTAPAREPAIGRAGSQVPPREKTKARKLIVSSSLFTSRVTRFFSSRYRFPVWNLQLPTTDHIIPGWEKNHSNRLNLSLSSPGVGCATLPQHLSKIQCVQGLGRYPRICNVEQQGARHKTWTELPPGRAAIGARVTLQKDLRFSNVGRELSTRVSGLNMWRELPRERSDDFGADLPPDVKARHCRLPSRKLCSVQLRGPEINAWQEPSP